MVARTVLILQCLLVTMVQVKPVFYILAAIQNADIATAKNLLAELEQDVSTNNIELVKARLLLKKKEVQLEKDQQKK